MITKHPNNPEKVLVNFTKDMF